MKKQFIFAITALLICSIRENLAAQTANEQEIALEAGLRELGQPKHETLYVDRAKAVVLAVDDTDRVLPGEVSAMRIALSDTNMARLRKDFAARLASIAGKMK